jgi:hypothetical protein
MAPSNWRIVRVVNQILQTVTRIQLALSAADMELLDAMAELTRSKRTDVVKSALGVIRVQISFFTQSPLLKTLDIARL